MISRFAWAFLLLPALWGQIPPTVVVSQIYGGGGNSGSTLRNDFIELFNRGNAAVDVSGWSVQYGAATSGSWQRTLLSGTIGPGQYYLIQEQQGAGGAVALPAADAIGTIDLSATSGKVALVSNATTLMTSAPAGMAIVDFVGYGSANFSEGAAAPALTNTTAAIRNGAGCTDTNNNLADFSAGLPAPRNRLSPLNTCVTPPQISELKNGASLTAGVVAPGEVVTILGFNFGLSMRVEMELAADGQHVTTRLASLRVLFDGVPAPLLYAAPNEIGAVAPFSISGRTTTVVQIDRNGLVSNSLTVPVSPSAPGIFTVNPQGQASATNQDSTANNAANPAARGSTVTINATGGGQTMPDGEDGLIVGAPIPKLRLPVTVLIGGAEAIVAGAGAAPGMVSGLVQIKAVVPASLAAGGSVPLQIFIGGVSTQPGVTIAIAAPPPSDTDPEIEQKLQQLKTDATLSPLPEIPNDKAAIPADWLALVSWNTQVGGTSTAANAQRPPLVQAALANLFSGTYQLLAAQEVPSAASADKLQTMLPGGSTAWQGSFFDTTDTQDNGYWFRTGITLRDAFPLFVTGQTDAQGRFITDAAKAVHPPQVAQFEAGDFDFTLITVHLTFAGGNTSESLREMRGILDYLDWYFNQPDHDPDVIVCGDFNTPSALSGRTGTGGVTLDSVFDQDPRFQTGERRFVVTVHQPTSRSSAAAGGMPVSNYDHCVFSASTMREYIQARRVSTDILTEHPEDPEMRLTSDHFPIVAFLKTRGAGIALDRKTRIRPDTTP